MSRSLLFSGFLAVFLSSTVYADISPFPHWPRDFYVDGSGFSPESAAQDAMANAAAQEKAFQLTCSGRFSCETDKPACLPQPPGCEPGADPTCAVTPTTWGCSISGRCDCE